jgi:hypothetical protein
MFFKREKPRTITFEDRMQALRQLGFKTESASGGKTLVSRDGLGIHVSPSGDAVVEGKPGLLIGNDIGVLTHGGYQMFFRTEAGVMRPAQAHQLKALHAFTEDLKEGLGETSLYNESLGTTCESHLYDRVQQRDAGVPHKAWER